MRKVSALPSPRPRGWGFLFGGAFALAVLIGAPAHASVPVVFEVHLGTLDLPAVIACDLSVADDASGKAVLDSAVANGCIDSYHTQHYSFGDFVTCINHLCDLPWHEADQTTPADSFSPLYWEMFVNAAPATVGISDYHVQPGDNLAFTLTTWVGCPTVCP